MQNGLLCFEDDQLDIMYEVINKLQICFHPQYAPEGKFSAHALFELQNNDKSVLVIADNNLISPICEIATNGTTSDDRRLRIAALFVTWSKFIRSRLTCGMGLLENDTSGLCAVSGEERRLQFLHGVDNIPPQIWKDLAFGIIDKVPSPFLYPKETHEEKNYDFSGDLLYLCNELAMVKLVQFIRNSELSPIEKFLSFMIWYADHLDIAESIVIYAAMVFTNTPDVEWPKGCRSGDYQKVVKGIKNQAWDITYLTAWSMEYQKETEQDIWMFATDDITQKQIVVNIIPPGQCGETLAAIFNTKSQREKLQRLWAEKFGTARVRPFGGMSEEEKVSTVQDLLSTEYRVLRAQI